MPRILFLNRSYFPDAEATGQLLTELSEDLAQEKMSVSVIVGQPNTNPSGATYRRYGSEPINGVTVRRVWHTRFAKQSRLGRACNLITFTMSATLAGLFGKRPDVVVTETDPPLLCLVGRILAVRFRCRFVAYLQDIHPELGLALGKMRGTRTTKWLQGLFHSAYRNADRVVVLSRDMGQYLQRIGVPSNRIERITNWVDTRRITPAKSANGLRHEWNVGDRFLVMYSGNLGVCQDLDSILSAAELLKSQTNIRFMLIGNGVSKQALVERAKIKNLDNVQFADYQPLERLGESLSAADLHLVPVASRAIHYLMPSKLYGILASGTPLIALAPQRSELAELLEEERVGVAIPPNDPQMLAEKILWFSQWCPDRAAYGQRARALAVRQFDRKHSVARFAAMLNEVTGVRCQVSEKTHSSSLSSDTCDLSSALSDPVAGSPGR